MKFAACIALCGGAMIGSAHASVTLYGIVDANIEYTTNVRTSNGSSANTLGMRSGGYSGSRWGMRGVEDLGGGLSAVFTLENGFAIDNGTLEQGGRLFGRTAWVGLDSKTYGRLTLGRQYTSMWSALFDFSPTAYANHREPYVIMRGNNARSDNNVKYSGTFGPVTTFAHWSFGNGFAAANGGGAGEVPGSFRRDTAFGAGLVYRAGQFGVSASYDQFNPSQPSTGTVIGTGKHRKAGIAGKYSFTNGQVMAGYRWGKDVNASGMTTVRDDFYWIGGSYKVAPAVKMTMAYYYRDIKHAAVSDPWQLTFIAEYGLSKRTDLYLTSAYSKNAGINLDGSYALAPGKNSMLSTAVGIRHRF